MLIYPILYEALLLTILFILVHVPEKVTEGLFRAKTIVASCRASAAAVPRGS
jgi:hypothetical protein